jgi:hypothetical protein
MSVKSLSIVAAAVLALAATGAQAASVFYNGGFEIGQTTPVVDPTNAQGWLDAAAGYSRSSDAHSGSYSAEIGCPGFCGSVMLQNSVKDGGMADLSAGDALTLSFWAKGDVGGTGNVLFALRYLDGVGNIKYDSLNQFFQGSINSSTWSEITFTPAVVPVGATAAFIEFSTATGPGATYVRIDDLSLAAPVPEPETYALMLAGLLGVGALVRRRRSA